MQPDLSDTHRCTTYSEKGAFQGKVNECKLAGKEEKQHGSGIEGDKKPRVAKNPDSLLDLSEDP